MSVDPVAAYVDAAAAAIALPLPAEYRDDAIAAMRVFLAQAALVMEFPLPETIEQLPVATV